MAGNREEIRRVTVPIYMQGSESQCSFYRSYKEDSIEITRCAHPIVMANYTLGKKHDKGRFPRYMQCCNQCPFNTQRQGAGNVQSV